MRQSRVFVLFLIVLALPACARRQAYIPKAEFAYAQGGPYQPVLAAAPVLAQEPYILDSGDRLRIQVFGQEGLTNAYVVDAAGFVTLSLIGGVPARGATTADLQRAITDKLQQGYIRAPYVSVEIEAYRPFFILGEVNAPGQYPYIPNMTAEAAVAVAGGYAPRADRKDIRVSRMFNGQTERVKVPPEYALKPGDTITVKERWF